MILAVDQGTTGTTSLLVDDELRVVDRTYAPVSVSTPRPGWVEQDPRELWSSVEQAIAAAGSVDAIGITNQRETTIVWDRRTGEPVHPAIVWQDRRTADRCRELDADLIRARTGLTCDPYFSATKLEWILREKAKGDLAFGTVDTWLLWNLTGGEVHATDATNASRTMLLDLETLDWSDELLELFGVPREVLPEVHPSAHAYGGNVAALAGDQQASLFAHGAAKATIGTGAFILVPSDASAPRGLVRTAAAGGGYALEGSVFVAGAAVQWLRDGLGILADSAESEALARSIDSTDGVYFVPALTGLGSPHWAPDARGLVSGITRGTRREHLVRAALESIAYQIGDVVDVMPERPSVLRLDGGATANAWLMQFLADVLQMPIEVSPEKEMTALGAAALAGLSLGKWTSSDLDALRSSGSRYEPLRDESAAVAGWRDAVERTVA